MITISLFVSKYPMMVDREREKNVRRLGWCWLLFCCILTIISTAFDLEEIEHNHWATRIQLSISTDRTHFPSWKTESNFCQSMRQVIEWNTSTEQKKIDNGEMYSHPSFVGYLDHLFTTIAQIRNEMTLQLHRARVSTLTKGEKKMKWRVLQWWTCDDHKR